MYSKKIQLKLKIAWFNNFLGLSIDQVNSNQQYPLTPYYFWPKTEAWELLRLDLNSKGWLSQEEKFKILQITGDVMEYWLSYRDIKTCKNLQEDFTEIEVVTIK